MEGIDSYGYAPGDWLSIGPAQISACGLKPWLDGMRLGLDATRQLSVHVRATNLTSEDVKDIEEFICAFPNVYALYLHMCHLEDDSLVHIIRLIQNKPLQSLWLTDNLFTPQGIAQLANGLHGTKLRKLTLDNNYVGSAGCAALARAIPKSNLAWISLEGCNLQVKDMCAILKASRNSKIEFLDLSQNFLGTKLGMRNVNRLLANNNGRLEYLQMRDCGITNSGLGIIAPGVAKSRGLIELNINFNPKVAIKSVERMLDIIEYHPSLEDVNVFGCSGYSGLYTGVYMDPVARRIDLWRRARFMIAMVSARVIERIGCKSILAIFPIDLFRALKVMLGDHMVDN